MLSPDQTEAEASSVLKVTKHLDPSTTKDQLTTKRVEDKKQRGFPITKPDVEPIDDSNFCAKLQDDVHVIRKSQFDQNTNMILESQMPYSYKQQSKLELERELCKEWRNLCKILQRAQPELLSSFSQQQTCKLVVERAYNQPLRLREEHHAVRTQLVQMKLPLSSIIRIFELLSTV
jgi:hypothetical protein